MDIIDDDGAVVGTVLHPASAQPNEEERAFAEEIVKRFNAYPRLIAFIQQVGRFTDKQNAELEDFITNCYGDVMDNEEGEPIEEEIQYFNNPDIWEQE